MVRLAVVKEPRRRPGRQARRPRLGGGREGGGGLGLGRDDRAVVQEPLQV